MSATRINQKISKTDEYMTPQGAIDSIMPEIWTSAITSFLEPCAGSGNIVKAFNQLVSPKKCQSDWCEIADGRDFFDSFKILLPEYDLIITNPPFSDAALFIDTCTGFSNCVIMLLRLNYFGSKGRKEWWQTRLPTHLFTLSERPSFLDRKGSRVLNKDGKPGTDACEYAWFCWDKTGLVKRPHGMYVL